MKTCPNCRCVYDDEYGGQCGECGKPLGAVAPNGGGGLGFAYARQIQKGSRENAQEIAMRRGNYDGVPLEQSILDVARGFVTVNRQKYIEAGGDPNDL